jgi:hypothetical protein
VVGLIVGLIGQVFLESRQEFLEPAQAEMVIEFFHLAQRVTNQILIADFIKARPIDQALSLLQFLVKAKEGVEYIFLHPGKRRPLEAVLLIQHIPGLDRGWKNDIGIANDMNEPGIREKLKRALIRQL